jgi:hypothetical protein
LRTSFTLVLSASLVLGCSFDKSALSPLDSTVVTDTGTAETGGPADSSPIDATPMDSSEPTDTSTGSDASTLDAGFDTSMPDSSPVDTSTPPDTSMPPPSCDDLFDGLDGYVRCEEAPTACEFYSDPMPSEMSCDELCATAGQSCLGTWSENGGGRLCGRIDNRSGCGDPGDAFICRCTRPGG